MVLKTKEQAIQDDIRVALAEHGYVVFRANVGKVKTADGRWFDSGLPVGFPDLFGFNPSNGKIYFIEVKTQTGHRRPDQVRFANFLRDKAAIYGVARSTDEALNIVDNELKILNDRGN